MIVASIDLMNGKAVQLRQGREPVLERGDVEELAADFDRFGEVAVIDLDAALGKGDNGAILTRLLTLADCRVGGGIRTVEQALKWVSLGARKVIIGSQAFLDDTINHTFLGELRDAITPERVIIAIDARNGSIVTKGWRHDTGLNVLETVDALEPYAGEFLFTSVENEGMMAGTDIDLVKVLRSRSRRRITVAGGVSTLDEVGELARLGVDCQLGMALYTGAVDLGDGFITALDWRKAPLIPTITQDTRGRVLMQGYSNGDSLRAAFSTGLMTYWSRSRRDLWTKGETSGHVQRLVRLRADCDRDTILATVEQVGPACHTGSDTCFGEKPFRLEDLYEVIRDRFANPPEGSYTARLAKGPLLAEKILEEAKEVVEAETRDEIVWEAADVLYFLTALLARHGVEVEAVLAELRRRRFQ